MRRDGLPADRRLWGFLLVILLIDVSICPWRGIRPDLDPSILGSGCAVLLLAGLGRGRWPGWSNGALVAEGLVAFVLSILVMMPVADLAVRSPFPAVDVLLERWEGAAGFDPAALHRWVMARPVVATMLHAAYASYLVSYLAILCAAPSSRFPGRGLELMRLSVVSLAISDGVAFLLPTIGTMPALERWATAWHVLHDTRDAFDVGTVSAIISLPSFHTEMAVLLLHAVRGWPRVFRAMAVLNAIMVLATPVFGFHHLADLAAGAGIALLAIRLCGDPGGRRGAVPSSREGSARWNAPAVRFPAPAGTAGPGPRV